MQICHKNDNITNNLKLLKWNRKEKDILVVDSKVQGFAYNITNGVFVPPFEGPVNNNIRNSDDFFMYLSGYLKGFKEVDDVRK